MEELYPGLLDSSRPQKVEVFVPLNHKAVPEEVTSELEDSLNHFSPLNTETAEKIAGVTPPKGQSAGLSNGEVEQRHSPFVGQSPSQSINFLRRINETDVQTHHQVATPPNDVATPPVNMTPPLSAPARPFSEHSWEVLSRYSTTSNRLSILQDQSDPEYDLVPLWECLQVLYANLY